MQNFSKLPLVASVVLLLSSHSVLAQDFQSMNQDDIVIPNTSVVRPWQRGYYAHTNHVIFDRRYGVMTADVDPNGGLGPSGGMTPMQVRSFYNMPSNGGSGVIVLVGAYHYPTALNDFNVFSRQFGLPAEISTDATASTNAVFQVVYASGAQPATNAGWAQEAALDIEWAHAMAPRAKIVLIEARSNSYSDLFTAVDKARTIPGVRQVSMSWGGDEFSGEAYYDAYFPQNSGIVYFASSGDTGGMVEYPSCSPNVVAVGGTRVQTSSAGVIVSETGWSGSGGGVSLYEPKPSYQNRLYLGTNRRVVPDISAIADPSTGVSVYCTTSNGGMQGWLVFGGTSVSSPCVAGMTNVCGNKYSSSLQELGSIYSHIGMGTLRDILTGTAGSFTAGPGWDFVTGVGTPYGTGTL